MKLLRLKEILQERGLSGKDFAQQIEVTPVTISRIVGGKAFPSPELLHKIATVLNIDIRDLFYSTKEAQPIFIEQAGKFIRIGELDREKFESLDEGSVPDKTNLNT